MAGPQCILTCAKEHRVLPKEGYTCCLAMDGVKVLASGFEKDEKVKLLHIFIHCPVWMLSDYLNYFWLLVFSYV